MGKGLPPADDGEEDIETPLIITENGKAMSDAGTDSTDVTVHGASMYMGVDKSTLLGTGDEGLTAKEAERRLALFGRNELKDEKVSPFIKLLKSFIAPIPVSFFLFLFLLLLLLLLFLPPAWREGGAGERKAPRRCFRRVEHSSVSVVCEQIMIWIAIIVEAVEKDW